MFATDAASSGENALDTPKWVRNRYPFANKKHFHDLCLRNGIPTAPVLALGYKGRVIPVNSDKMSFPPEDLFLKPRGLRGGLGAQVWCYRDGRYYRQGSQQDGWAGLELWLRKMAIQPNWGSFGRLSKLIWSGVIRQTLGDHGSLDVAELVRHIVHLSLQCKSLCSPGCGRTLPLPT